MKLGKAKDEIFLYLLYEFQLHIRYTFRDMIPPNQGSSLLLNTIINRWPRDNCYISGQEGPNQILQDVADREQTVVYVV